MFVKNFVLLLFLLRCCIIDARATSHRIICDSGCSQNSSSSSFCSVKSLVYVPYPEEDEITAPAPVSLEGSWYTYTKHNGNKAIAFNLTWKQKGNFDLVTGYFISILRSASTSDFKRHISFDKSQIKSKILEEDEVITTFTCFGRNGEDLSPDYNYFVTLNSLPMYHSDSEIKENDVDMFINIPGCDDPIINQTKRCIPRTKEYDNSYEDDEEDYDYEDDYTDEADDERKKIENFQNTSASTTIIILLVIVIFVILATTIAVGLVFVYRRRLRSSNRNEESRPLKDDEKLLILVDTRDHDPSYRNVANMLATMFGPKHVCNLWHHYNIDDPDEWVAEQSDSCRHVLFICSPETKLQWKKRSGDGDTFTAGLRRHMDDSIKSLGVTTVYFDEKPSLPRGLLKRVNQFQLPEKLDQVFRHLRSKVSLKEKGAELEQLRSAITCNLRTAPSHSVYNSKTDSIESNSTVTESLETYVEISV